MGLLPPTIFRPISRATVSPRPSTLILKTFAGYADASYDTSLSSNTTNLTAGSVGIASVYPAAQVDTTRTLYFEWYSSGDGITAGSDGVFSPILSSNTSDIVTGTSGTYLEATFLSSNTSDITASTYGDLWLDSAKKNWIAWSDVGSLDFSIKQSNVAGNMPLDWEGYVHNIHKLNDKVIAYGVNGVSILTPAGKAYGLNTIHKSGLKGRDAFAGNDFVHYFIDNLGCLYSLSDQLRKHDYREYLSLLTNPVLTLDEDNNLLYICDGTTGYVYSPEDKSLGKGPVNVTGVGRSLTASSGIVTTPVFEICTDIFDFGTRRMKSVYQLEFSTDVSGVLSAAIDYRESKSASFTTTPWETVHERGIVKIIRKGIEFRFRAKLAAYEYFEMDSLTIDGHVHVH